MIPAPLGPFESEDAALGELAVQAVYEASRRHPGQAKMQDGAEAMILAACKRAGVSPGAYDARIIRWLAGFEPQACAVIAGLIARAAGAKPGPHAVVFDLAADDEGTTYFVLSEALEDFASRQRDQAQHEGGNPSRDRWARRAEEMREAVEAAMDGDPS